MNKIGEFPITPEGEKIKIDLPYSENVKHIKHHSGPGMYAVFDLEINQGQENKIEVFSDIDNKINESSDADYNKFLGNIKNNSLLGVKDFLEELSQSGKYLDGLTINISNIKTHEVDTAVWHFRVAILDTLRKIIK